ncbi:MAG TPA: hypothetical protein VFC84_02645 [Desulfosporosinus sp.]|nr:hypothetical protein [Desulfosporosinus sp.]
MTITGNIAGSLATDSIQTGDLNVLTQYPDQCTKRFGKFIQRGLLKKVEYNRYWEEKKEFSELVRKTWFAFPEYFDA